MGPIANALANEDRKLDPAVPGPKKQDLKTRNSKCVCKNNLDMDTLFTIVYVL